MISCRIYHIFTYTQYTYYIRIHIWYEQLWTIKNKTMIILIIWSPHPAIQICVAVQLQVKLHGAAATHLPSDRNTWNWIDAMWLLLGKDSRLSQFSLMKSDYFSSCLMLFIICVYPFYRPQVVKEHISKDFSCRLWTVTTCHGCLVTGTSLLTQDAQNPLGLRPQSQARFVGESFDKLHEFQLILAIQVLWKSFSFFLGVWFCLNLFWVNAGGFCIQSDYK